jgi:hypothetical protein
MKVEVTEYDFGFWFDFMPESQQDVINLIRLGMNVTKERLFLSSYCDKEKVYTQMSISKRKQPVSKIKSGR